MNPVGNVSFKAPGTSNPTTVILTTTCSPGATIVVSVSKDRVTLGAPSAPTTIVTLESPVTVVLRCASFASLSVSVPSKS